MTATLLSLFVALGTPPQAPPLLASVEPEQAPALKVDLVAELWARVKGGTEVTVYVGQDVPKGAVNAVRLESFDGEKSGVYRCFLYTGEPSYERVESAPIPSPEKAAGAYADPIGWHRHKCESPTCGFVWSHPDGTASAGHYCPGCGKYENDKYRGNSPPTVSAPVLAKPKRVSLGGKFYDQYSDGRLVECAT